MENIIFQLPLKKSSGPYGFTGMSFQTFDKQIIGMIHALFWKQWERWKAAPFIL